MTITTLHITVLALSAIIIASLMEWYKKGLRKNNAKKGEIISIAALLSFGLALVCYYGFTLPGSLISLVLYGLGIFLIQWLVDVKVIKAMLKALRNSWLKNHDIDPQCLPEDDDV